MAKEVGLSNAEVDLFGKKKAKVSLATLDRLQDVQNGRYVIVAGKLITMLLKTSAERSCLS